MISLSLLTAERKHMIETERRLRRWVRALIVVIAGNAVIIGGMQYAIITLRSQQTDVQGTYTALLDAEKKIQRTSLTQTITDLNNLVKIESTAFSTHPAWALSVADILADIPDQIMLTSLEIKKNGEVVLIGSAITRAAFLKLQETLAASPHLSNATTDATASKRENIPFTYQATLTSTAP